jgi:hypothetical protein
MSYLARITECEHGVAQPGICKEMVCDHPKRPHHLAFALECWCPGGTTTRIELDYEAATEKARSMYWVTKQPPPVNFEREVKLIVDAALGGTE